jgi:quinol monooxygenase YgiN
MIHVIIPFTVKTESVEIVKTLIKKFVSAIKKKEPGTLLYKSFQQTDAPTKFIHFMTFTDKAAEENHRVTEHCKKFVETLYPLCTELPKSSTFNEII